MKDGWNTRVFTNTDVQKGSGITCDFTTGIVTLAPGVYHISGLSMVAYASGPGSVFPYMPLVGNRRR